MALEPTFHGHVETTKDALLLFQAVINHGLNPVTRRPQEQERRDVIRSGSIFIFNEATSGIKRWTDGVPWSPSRILGNFLVYRQVQKKQNTEKQKSKRGRGRIKKEYKESPSSDNGGSAAGDIMGYNDVSLGGYINDDGSSTSTSTVLTTSQPQMPPGTPSSSAGPGQQRSLVGSLVDSERFEEDGLIKKTLSVKYREQQYHLVSYYKINEADNLPKPRDAKALRDLEIDEELMENQQYRHSLEQEDNGHQPSEPSLINSNVRAGPRRHSSRVQQQHHHHHHQPGHGHSHSQHIPSMPHGMGNSMAMQPYSALPLTANYTMYAPNDSMHHQFDIPTYDLNDGGAAAAAPEFMAQMYRTSTSGPSGPPPPSQQLQLPPPPGPPQSSAQPYVSQYRPFSLMGGASPHASMGGGSGGSNGGGGTPYGQANEYFTYSSSYPSQGMSMGTGNRQNSTGGPVLTTPQQQQFASLQPMNQQYYTYPSHDHSANPRQLPDSNPPPGPGQDSGPRGSNASSQQLSPTSQAALPPPPPPQSQPQPGGSPATHVIGPSSNPNSSQQNNNATGGSAGAGYGYYNPF